jgi:hypothetical protein
MKELYEKIYIKSESDLPKVPGNYIAHSKSRKIGWWGYDCTETKDDIITWMTYVDWYLLPVKDSLREELTLKGSLPSDEENKVKFLINDVCKWEDSPGYDSLEKTLSDKYFVQFKTK